MWISFAYTIDAVIMGRKTRTRRNWANAHARKFWAEQVCDFYDRNPRNHGQIMGSIRVMVAPWRQNTRQLTALDFDAEGFGYMTERNEKIGGLDPAIFLQRWKLEAVDLWVMDFELDLLSFWGMERKLFLQEQE